MVGEAIHALCLKQSVRSGEISIEEIEDLIDKWVPRLRGSDDRTNFAKAIKAELGRM